jgi:hypothetical protein
VDSPSAIARGGAGDCRMPAQDIRKGHKAKAIVGAAGRFSSGILGFSHEPPAEQNRSTIRLLVVEQGASCTNVTLPSSSYPFVRNLIFMSCTQKRDLGVV